MTLGNGVDYVGRVPFGDDVTNPLVPIPLPVTNFPTRYAHPWTLSVRNWGAGLGKYAATKLPQNK